jgi:hypothetical protein
VYEPWLFALLNINATFVGLPTIATSNTSASLAVDETAAAAAADAAVLKAVTVAGVIAILGIFYHPFYK